MPYHNCFGVIQARVMLLRLGASNSGHHNNTIVATNKKRTSCPSGGGHNYPYRCTVSIAQSNIGRASILLAVAR